MPFQIYEQFPTWLLAIQAFAVGTALAVAFNQAVLRTGVAYRWCRRTAIRCGWPSIARSAGLAVTRDKKLVAAGQGHVSLYSLATQPLDKVPATGSAAPKTQTIERLPKLSRGRLTPSKAAITWEVRPARGQSLDAVTAVTDQLAAAMQVHQVTLDRVRPDRGRLTVVLQDQLTVSRPWPGPGSGVGVTAVGDRLNLPLLGGHYLLAGQTGAGKSAWLFSLLADITTSGVPHKILFVDPKVVEVGPWAPLCDRVIVDLPEVSTALAALHAEVVNRYQQLAAQGLRKLEQPTEAMPALVLVIDEMGEVARQAPGEGRDAPKERLRLLASLAAVGRAAGLVIVAATQRPSAALIGADLRQNLGRRVACRMPDPYGAEAVLGPVAADLKPWLIDPAVPGTAWVQSEAHPHPVLARCWWVSEEAVQSIVAAHHRPRPAQLEAVSHG